MARSRQERRCPYNDVAEEDLAGVVHTLKQVVCVKGRDGMRGPGPSAAGSVSCDSSFTRAPVPCQRS